MTQESTAKKNTQKLQRAIVDGLEDVKAQDIQVFDTEHLSSLFERVIVASGTSNRQTKALAASVREAVREAGFPKPRIEGEANGEWIIVDCAQAVVHIMQPTFRSYYHLEELWGEKPVRLKFGTRKPAAKVVAPVAAPAAKSTRKAAPTKAAATRTARKTKAPTADVGRKPPVAAGSASTRAVAAPAKPAGKRAPAKAAPAATRAAAKTAPVVKRAPARVAPSAKATPGARKSAPRRPA